MAEEEPVFYLRQSTRDSLKLARKTNRAEEIDINRSLPTSSINADTVLDIINKLKTKAAVSVEELRLLKNALVDKKHIETVLQTHGALRGLVREMSGNNVNKQCQAVGCCCNLALGNERGCRVVAKAAGPYLVISVGSLSPEIAATSCGVLGNLAATSGKACELLMAQGALSKLADVAEASPDLEVVDSAVHAIWHFVNRLRDNLKPEHLQKLFQVTSKKDATLATNRLLFSLSCHPYFPSLDEIVVEFLVKTLRMLSKSMEKHFSCKKSVSCCDFVYIIRLLANLCICFKISDEVIKYFGLFKFGVSFRRIFSLGNDFVSKSLMWLLGNLLKYSTNTPVKEVFFCNIYGAL